MRPQMLVDVATLDNQHPDMYLVGSRQWCPVADTLAGHCRKVVSLVSQPHGESRPRPSHLAPLRYQGPVPPVEPDPVCPARPAIVAPPRGPPLPVPLTLLQSPIRRVISTSGQPRKRNRE